MYFTVPWNANNFCTTVVASLCFVTQTYVTITTNVENIVLRNICDCFEILPNQFIGLF